MKLILLVFLTACSPFWSSCANPLAPSEHRLTASATYHFEIPFNEDFDHLGLTSWIGQGATLQSAYRFSPPYALAFRPTGITKINTERPYDNPKRAIRVRFMVNLDDMTSRMPVPVVVPPSYMRLSLGVMGGGYPTIMELDFTASNILTVQSAGMTHTPNPGWPGGWQEITMESSQDFSSYRWNVPGFNSPGYHSLAFYTPNSSTQGSVNIRGSYKDISFTAYIDNVRAEALP